jgi:hypothetical protein
MSEALSEKGLDGRHHLCVLALRKVLQDKWRHDHWLALDNVVDIINTAALLQEDTQIVLSYLQRVVNKIFPDTSSTGNLFVTENVDQLHLYWHNSKKSGHRNDSINVTSLESTPTFPSFIGTHCHRRNNAPH